MRTLIMTVLLWSIACSATAGKDQFLTAGVSRTRALAMGSAYHSVVDDLSAGFYNPGAFKLNRTRAEKKYRLFFNPLGGGAAMYDYAKYDRDYIQDDELSLGECIIAASLFVKGGVFSTEIFDIGFGLGEEIITDDTSLTQKGRFLSVEKLNNGSFNSVFLNFKMSPSVSLGISGTLYQSRINGENINRKGYTFGVLLSPNPKLNVGIAYNQIPEKFSQGRMTLESLEGDTVTGGISYYPDDKTILSFDIRNLNKEDKQASREIHAGVERCAMNRIALRSGYFRDRQRQTDVYSFGIGLLPSWDKISKFKNSRRTDILSYTLIIEQQETAYHWHVVSLLLRY